MFDSLRTMFSVQVTSRMLCRYGGGQLSLVMLLADASGTFPLTRSPPCREHGGKHRAKRVQSCALLGKTRWANDICLST